jgi:anti-sigma-K factor RskA
VNIKEYIESGILESYIMGELSHDEEQEVVSMAEQYPEIREELSILEESLEQLARESAIAPPSSLKGKVFASIDAYEEPKASVSTEDTKVVPMTRSVTGLYKYAAAVSIILAVITSFLAFTYWQNWKNAENQVASLIAQNQQFAQNYNQVNQELDQLAQDVTIMNDSSFNRIVLKGTENSPQALAHVYWNDQSRQVYLSIQNLQRLSEDQQYQLWAIIDGNPVDAGVFDVARGLVRLNEIGQGVSAFAVTIEPAGGSKSPSLETMQVIGMVEG